MIENRPWWEDKRVLILWGLAGLVLLGWIAYLPQNRTQEARVLETAREMLGSGWRGWAVPHLNGKVRLEKPPLAYWLSAGSYELFGVSTWAGRLPMALFGWLTVGLTYIIGRWLLNARVGVFAAGTLLSCYLFYRYGRLAETDVLAGFFVTAAICCIWRGAAFSPSRLAWYHASAAAIALAILSKGPPGAFPILFLLGLALVDRHWRIVREYAKSGALLTLVVIAAPWFVYVSRLPEWEIVRREAAMVVTGGEDHYGPIYLYFPFLFKAALPWIGFVVVALIAATTFVFSAKHAARGPQSDRAAVRGLLLWTAVIFVPLSIVGQKQEHYLMPLMPPLMLLVGWVMDRAIAGPDRELTRGVTLTLGATATVGLLAALGPLVGARMARGQLIGLDVHMALLMAFLMLAVVVTFRLKGLQSALVLIIAGGVLLMTLALSVWAPSLQTVRYEHVAAAIHEARPGRPCVFYDKENLPLVYAMQRIAPLCRDEGELAAALARAPGTVVIVEWDKKKEKEKVVPPGLVERTRIAMDDRIFSLYR